MTLRASQVVASGVYVLVAGALVAGGPAWLWGGALTLLYLFKAGLFLPHLRKVHLTLPQLVVLALAQPLLDVSYTIGLVQGGWRVLRGVDARPIS